MASELARRIAKRVLVEINMVKYAGFGILEGIAVIVDEETAPLTKYIATVERITSDLKAGKDGE